MIRKEGGNVKEESDAASAWEAQAASRDSAHVLRIRSGERRQAAGFSVEPCANVWRREWAGTVDTGCLNHGSMTYMGRGESSLGLTPRAYRLNDTEPGVDCELKPGGPRPPLDSPKCLLSTKLWQVERH